MEITGKLIPAILVVKTWFSCAFVQNFVLKMFGVFLLFFFQEKATRCKTNITNEMLLINVSKVFFAELFIV